MEDFKSFKMNNIICNYFNYIVLVINHNIKSDFNTFVHCKKCLENTYR